jgi:hypothetical protein
MTALLRPILQGQLRIRAQRRLLSGVSIRRDGSSGRIIWGTLQRLWNPSPRQFDLVPDQYYTFTCAVEDRATQLQLTDLVRPHLLNLPKVIRERIFELVLRPSEGTHINLNSQAEFSCGLLYVNRDTYHGWRDCYLFENDFVLSMTTKQARTTFDNFKYLQRFLRKTFEPLPSATRQTRTIVGANDYCSYKELQYVLRFELETAVPLTDLRISILPFIMETLPSSADHEFKVEIWTVDADGDSSKVASHSLTLQKLRLNIITAMMSHLVLNQNVRLPDFWIDGLGKVISIEKPSGDSGGAWDMASDAVCDSAGFVHVLSLQPMDFRYRSGKTHAQCDYWSDGKFFPFHRNAEEILPFLMHGLNNSLLSSFHLFRENVLHL